MRCDDSDDGAPLPAVDRGMVIAGDAAGDKARQIAHAHQWPLLAEPTSGARTGAEAIPSYLSVLQGKRGQELVQQIHQVVVVGRPTLSRPVRALIDAAPALYVAGHGARWREAPRHAERILRDVPDSWLSTADWEQPARSSAWLAQWLDAAPKRAYKPERWSAEMVAHAFVQALKPGQLALLGSSGPIRMVDRLAPLWKPGKAPVLVANRGLAGIDGTISTAAGLALGSASPVMALMGDVTFLHDVGALLVGPLELRPHLRVVVVNDGGGTIFSGMEHATADPDRVRRVFTTPHDADLAGICAGYSVAHTAVTSLAGLKTALAAPLEGLEVVEAKLTS